MLESPSLQQIFLMSSAVEKVQQVQQQQPDVQARHMAVQFAEQSEQKKIEVQQFDKIYETIIRDEKREARHDNSRKKNEVENEDMGLFAEEEEKGYNSTDVKRAEHGKIVDIII